MYILVNLTHLTRDKVMPHNNVASHIKICSVHLPDTNSEKRLNGNQISTVTLKPPTAKLLNLNFHPLEDVSR